MGIENKSDIDALKEDAIYELIEDSKDFIDNEAANRRLNGLRDAKVLKGAEIPEEVKRLTGLNLPKDAAGGLIVPVGDNKLGRLAILEQTESSLVEYHSAMHEGVHLLGPDSFIVQPTIINRTVRKSMGPKGTYLTLDDFGNIIDVEKIPADEKLFWEAATDFVAAQKTIEKFGKEKTDKELVDNGIGFIQRYWIEYLINTHPYSEELLKALKKALYNGDENDFSNLLGEVYDTLLKIMLEGDNALNEGRLEDYNKALDKWMAIIKHHFK